MQVQHIFSLYCMQVQHIFSLYCLRERGRGGGRITTEPSIVLIMTLKPYLLKLIFPIRQLCVNITFQIPNIKICFQSIFQCFNFTIIMLLSNSNLNNYNKSINILSFCHLIECGKKSSKY